MLLYRHAQRVRRSSKNAIRCSEDNRRLILEKDELSATRNDELDAKLRELNKKLELYEEQVAWFKNKLYGRGTEQLTDAERLQIRLFDEIEQAADNDPPEDDAPSG